jgi:hypothetical protein
MVVADAAACYPYQTRVLVVETQSPRKAAVAMAVVAMGTEKVAGWAGMAVEQAVGIAPVATVCHSRLQNKILAALQEVLAAQRYPGLPEPGDLMALTPETGQSCHRPLVQAQDHQEAWEIHWEQEYHNWDMLLLPAAIHCRSWHNSWCTSPINLTWYTIRISSGFTDWLLRRKRTIRTKASVKPAWIYND